MSLSYNIFLKPTVNIAHKFYFNSIKVDFTERVPFNVGMLLAPNHPNSAVDPVGAGIRLKQQSYFLARGDVFTTKMNRFFLDQLNCIPIYRKTDDENYKEKNNETFKVCNESLADNKTILIFPEGICVQEYRLRPIKGGMALIAFTAAENFDFKKDFYILPYGQNYYAFTKFRSDFYGAYAEPIKINDFKEQYLENKEAAYKSLNEEVAKRMKENMWIIENPEDDEFFLNIRHILIEDIFENEAEAATNDRNRFLKFKALGEAIQSFRNEDIDSFLELKKQTENFKKECNDLGLRSKQINFKTLNENINGSILSKTILLLLTSPIAAYGFLINFIPYKITTHLANTKVKKVEFYASVNFVVGWLLFMIYYAILTGIVGGISNWKYALVILFTSPFLGLFAFNYYILFKNLKGLLQIKKYYSRAQNLLIEKTDIIKKSKRLIELTKEIRAKLK
jgi:glycerol-3-phosphate O-acyltransferase / dihydroxyacetone phosphate acyltransferase